MPTRDPVTVGAKVIQIAQVELTARVFGDKGQFEVAAKSPEVEIPAIVNSTD